jgi:uncharacterized membrane protein
MPHFETFSLMKWLHFVALSLGGGAIVVALLLSGFEEEREDLRGLAATVWKQMVAWPFRLALALGILLLVIQYKVLGIANPFEPRYLHIKLVLVLLLLAFSEMTPKALALGKRGAAMLALLCFLLTTFVAVNAGAFPQKVRPTQVVLAPEVAPSLQAR